MNFGLRHYFENVATSSTITFIGSRATRVKYANMPIPGGEVTMDGEALKAEGREEKATLIDELKELQEELNCPDEFIYRFIAHLVKKTQHLTILLTKNIKNCLFLKEKA